MQISKETLNIFKNYSTINSNLRIKEGNILKTVAQPVKNIISEIQIDEEFPVEFGIYDLNNFLSVLNMFNEPHLEFSNDSNYVTITDKNNKEQTFKYMGCNLKLIINPPKIDESKFKSVINFELTSDNLDKILRASSSSHLPDLSIESDGDNINLIVFDISNNSSNRFSIKVGDGDGTKYRMLLNPENLKIMKGNYDVAVAKNTLVKFTNKENGAIYYIALSKKSQYEG